jgi:hypothetical protein
LVTLGFPSGIAFLRLIICLIGFFDRIFLCVCHKMDFSHLQFSREISWCVKEGDFYLGHSLQHFPRKLHDQCSTSMLAQLPGATKNCSWVSVLIKPYAFLFNHLRYVETPFNLQQKSWASGFCCQASKNSNPLPNRASKDKKFSSPGITAGFFNSCPGFIHLVSFFLGNKSKHESKSG